MVWGWGTIIFDRLRVGGEQNHDVKNLRIYPFILSTGEREVSFFANFETAFWEISVLVSFCFTDMGDMRVFF